jgi:membrane protein implicated in regulation of membrane protease activity
VRKLFFIAGTLLIAVAFAWPWLSRLPFGRLPGDIAIERPGFRLYVPWVTMLIVSVVASLLLRFFRR